VTCTCQQREGALGEIGVVPQGYRAVVRRGSRRGIAKYGGGRLDEKLARLVRARRLQLSFEDIDLFQRIANVETGGAVNALNTWDSAVVSIGFLQLTLHYGALQDWIRRAPAAFARYGIAVDPQRTYEIVRGTRVAAIVGAPDRRVLRWSPWAERFYRAGLDDDVIVAQVAIGQARNAARLREVAQRLRSKRGAYDIFLGHYRRSGYLRGLFQEACNNRPAWAKTGAVKATIEAQRRGRMSTAAFTELVKRSIHAEFARRGDGGKATSIFRKTQVGARADVLTRPRAAAPEAAFAW
jgi:hypothetical protein